LRVVIAILSGAGLLCLTAATPAPEAWEKSVTTLPRGSFPDPRPLIATYQFGWSGVVAANGEIRFAKSDDHFQLVADGGTIGIVRALWKFDTHYRGAADATTLRPISLHQVDQRRRKTITTDLTFKPGSVERRRTDTSSKKPSDPKTYRFSGDVYDMFSALLYLRSQSLKQGEVYRVVVYPATNAYLATLTVVGRSPIVVPAGEYPAIKLDVQLKKIGKDGQLEPHKKFRHATVWVSEDSDRLLLRVEASIFVGSVFAELQSVRFPDSGSAISPNDQAPISPDTLAAQETGAREE
jgi:hypothetical protein